MQRIKALGSFYLVFACALSACDGSHSPLLTQNAPGSAPATSPGTPGAPGISAHNVTIPPGAVGKGPAAFGTNPLIIPTGATVTWTNADSMAHTATANDGSFNTGVIEPGASATSPPFKTPGTFPYYCTIHGQVSMNGTIQVTQ
jgi:plastocyanin